MMWRNEFKKALQDGLMAEPGATVTDDGRVMLTQPIDLDQVCDRVAAGAKMFEMVGIPVMTMEQLFERSKPKTGH